jgi:dolichol-phosphate mannosyltransferase
VKLVAVIPTYNEAGTLGALVDGLFAHCAAPYELHVLVVDDASPDGTAEVAAAAGLRWPGRVEIVRRPAKSGLTAAYVAGFVRALADGAEYVLQMDADGSHDPAVLPALLAAMVDADVVIGSRYVSGSARDSRGGHYRRTISRFANALVARLIPGLTISDPTSGYRLWRRAALLRVEPSEQVRSRAYGLQMEMTLLAASAGCRLVEVPINFGERQAGRSKMTPGVQLQTAYEIMRLSFAQRRAVPLPHRAATGVVSVIDPPLETRSPPASP